MDSAYFESSVYIAIFSGEDRAQDVKALVRELRKDHAKICTSIITVQEVSVICYRAGGQQVDNYAKVERLTDRIYGVNREIVLLAAQLEAQLLDRAKKLAKEKRADRRAPAAEDRLHSRGDSASPQLLLVLI